MSAPNDSDMAWPVASSAAIYDGPVVSLRRDTLSDSDGTTFDRDVVSHRGSVGVVAIDDEERLLVVTQYRHPARQRLAELPAGLLDHDGEDRQGAAVRELAEEGHVRAERWSPLIELVLSPGISDETITVFLAEGISPVGVPPGFVARHEEASMTRQWVPLADVVAAVLAGRIKNAALVAGVLALWAHRSRPPAGPTSA